MTSTAAASTNPIEASPADTSAASASPAASFSSSSSSSPSSSLSFASLLTSSSASLGGTIGSTAHPDHITPMAPLNSSSSSSASSAGSGDGSSSGPSLPFDVRGWLESVKQRQLHRRIRPASAFFDPQRFSRPQSSTEATTRVELNLQWFFVNYLLIAALILVLTLLSQPSLIVALLVLAALWLFAFTRDVIAIPYTPYSLSGRSKLVSMYAVTAVLLLVFAGTTILTVVGVCGLVVLGHATLHATPTQEERDSDEQLDSITMV